ncbi:retroviral-like aspartic protease family protein [Ancylothrix sp. C2]|uniref:retropepsin-like aspartic protease n=1 Tax=Ancylothrix sp. D3o TaxID=2953691 RepID=UPI0021BAB3A9|nr:retropepsin-like aspartic protease [Ancylothrix sp. D3o]MCT7951318.1 retroviral-like aspartic protease family protein [Ancylothrix sp. D3o]
MKRFWKVALSIGFLSTGTLTLISLPNFAQTPTPPAGEAILEEVVNCVKNSISPEQTGSLEAIETASTQCIFKVVMLAPDGSIRRDAKERMIAIVKTTGITLPQPSSQGQATITMQPVPEQKLLTVPVNLGGKPASFLLDTGASNSVVDAKIVEQLNVKGTPIPKELLAFMVVGENCAEINATIHPLPVLAVEAAKVEGVTGMALPQTAIPAKVGGVLGMDFISGFDMILNPKTLELQFLPSTTPTSDAIPLTGNMGIMTAEVKINGQGPFTFLIDTGAEMMVLSDKVAPKISLDLSKAEPIEVKGFCGKEMGKKMALEQFSIQQYQTQNLEAVVLESKVLQFLGVDGIVGQNFLNQYQQHWRFGKRNQLGYPDVGSLSLTRL